MKKLLTAAAVIVGLMGAAHGQGGIRMAPLGFCPLASMTASTALAACSGGVPGATTYAVICAYVQGVVWRDDGIAPTGTPGTGGQGIAAGQCISYNATNFAAIRFIQQASGALLGVTFYQ